MGESEESGSDESESESDEEELDEEASPSPKAKAVAAAPKLAPKLAKAAAPKPWKGMPKVKMGKPGPKPKETKAELKAKEAKLLVKQAKGAKSKVKAGKTPGATVKLAKAAALCAIAEAEKEMTEIVPYFWEKKDPGCKACTTRRHVAHTCTYRGRHPGRKARPKHMTAAASAAAAKKAAEQALAELARSPGKAGKTMKKMAVLRAGSKSPLPGKSLKLIMRNVTAPSPKPQRATSTPGPSQKEDLKRPRTLSDSAIGAAEAQRRRSSSDALWGDGYLLDRSFAPKKIEQMVVKEILTPTFRNLKTPSPGGGAANVFDFAPIMDGAKRSVHSIQTEDLEALEDMVFDERHSAGEAMEKERHQGVAPIPEETEPTAPESPDSATDTKNFVFPKQDRRSANGPGRWANHAPFKPREFMAI